MKLLSATAALAVALTIGAGTVAAEVTPAPGYIYGAQVLSEFTEGCVAVAGGGFFAGVGPDLPFPAPGRTRSVIFVSESGAERTVAVDFNAIGDCLYDREADVLYVVDNGLEFSGALTGDTVIAIPAASTAEGLSAFGLELVTAGSIGGGAGIARDAAGDLYVSDAVGGGQGNVVKISAGGLTSFIASGFDFTGGVSVDAAGDLFVAESLGGSFASQISRFDAAGAFQETFSSPNFQHGSVDLAFDDAGTLLVTGGNETIASVGAGGAVTRLVSGLDSSYGFAAFGGSLAVDAFSGRIGFLARPFEAVDDDRSIHQLVPIERLVTGKGRDKSECLLEFYGLELVPKKPGKPAKLAICVDGAACDADGAVNDSCLFPVGLCLNVDDQRLPECESTGVAAAELLKSLPEGGDLASLVADIQAAAPLTASTCFFSDGVAVPVKFGRRDSRKPGKGLVRVKVTPVDSQVPRDKDTVKLVCMPAAVE